ncbi:hypothetical protein ACJX0J_015675, partial [Zea mays]
SLVREKKTIYCFLNLLFLVGINQKKVGLFFYQNLYSRFLPLEDEKLDFTSSTLSTLAYWFDPSVVYFTSIMPNLLYISISMNPPHPFENPKASFMILAGGKRKATMSNFQVWKTLFITRDDKLDGYNISLLASTLHNTTPSVSGVISVEKLNFIQLNFRIYLIYPIYIRVFIISFLTDTKNYYSLESQLYFGLFGLPELMFPLSKKIIIKEHIQHHSGF